MITESKEAMDYLYKNKRNGNVRELEGMINSETIKKLQQVGNISVNVFNRDYKLNLENYKYIYSDKTSFWDKFMGLFCHYILKV